MMMVPVPSQRSNLTYHSYKVFLDIYKTQEETNTLDLQMTLGRLQRGETVTISPNKYQILSCGSNNCDSEDDSYFANEIYLESSDEGNLQFKEIPSSPRDTKKPFRNIIEIENNIHNNRIETEAGKLLKTDESVSRLDLVPDELVSPTGSEKRLQFPTKRSRSRLLFNNKSRNSIGVRDYTHPRIASHVMFSHEKVKPRKF